MALKTNINPEVLELFKITGEPEFVPSGQRRVYKVVADGKLAMLKIMALGPATDRLPREMEIYRRFSAEPGIPSVIDLKFIDEHFVLLEEFVEGSALNKLIDSYRGEAVGVKLLLSKLVTILIPVWHQGFIHRDIKPDNIIIRPGGAPVILDFGIAKDLNGASVTEVGFQPLSALYAAPEQYRAEKSMISYRTDMFSLGVLGYRLFYGALPFGNTKEAIESRFLSNSPVELEAESPLFGFLSACLSLSPAGRPRRPETLIQLLS